MWSCDLALGPYLQPVVRQPLVPGHRGLRPLDSYWNGFFWSCFKKNRILIHLMEKGWGIDQLCGIILIFFARFEKIFRNFLLGWQKKSCTAFRLEKKPWIQTTLVTIMAQSPVKCPTYNHERQPTAINHFVCTVLPGSRSSGDVLCDHNFTEDQKYSALYNNVLSTPSRIATLFRLGQLPELNSLSHFDF